MEQQFMEEGLKNPELGPHYFSAQAAAEKIAAQVNPDLFKPMVEKLVEDIHEKILDSVQNYLVSNVENNVQTEIWCGVDNCVNALLKGDRWPLERYALRDRYDAERVRAAIAKHIPDELLSARMKDLEKENKSLREDVEMLRRMR